MYICKYILYIYSIYILYIYYIYTYIYIYIHIYIYIGKKKHHFFTERFDLQKCKRIQNLKQFEKGILNLIYFMIYYDLCTYIHTYIRLKVFEGLYKPKYSSIRNK